MYIVESDSCSVDTPKGPEKTLLVCIVESDSCSVDTSQSKRGAKLVVKIKSKLPTRGLKMFLYRP